LIKINLVAKLQMNGCFGKAAVQRLSVRPETAMGRSQQTGFSAHAKCCGTAFDK
jgi:hypothetical protein